MKHASVPRRTPVWAALAAVCAAAVCLAGSAQAAAPHPAAPHPAELARRIDRHLARVCEQAGFEPAPVVDDGNFLRRASLDLIGRIPTVAESRAFIADADPGKREKIVEQLHASSAHGRHFATFWRRTWVPQADTPQFSRLSEDFELWVAGRLRDGASYQDLARELLTATVVATNDRFSRTSVAPPQGFLAANEFKAENLASSTTRAFLGINLTCAQCHDHPFARWTRDQFWQTAAFFSRPEMPAAESTAAESTAAESKPAESNAAESNAVPTGAGQSDVVQTVALRLTIPETEREVTAALLDGRPVNWPDALEDDSGRRLLADWVTAPDNPYFARNAVNRLWAHFFGVGLVEPLEDLSVENAPSHPELLDELSQAFIASGFDLSYLTRAMVLSQAYQRTSAGTRSADEEHLFTHMPVRGLTGEQLYDSLRVAAGLPVERDDLGTVAYTPTFFSVPGGKRGRFAAEFYTERPSAAQRSIVQALSLMNGELTEELTDAQHNPTLAAAAGAPFLDTRGRVETLFLAALGRRPTPDEWSTATAYVEQGGADGDLRKALSDVFWALLNSSEFNTNY